jgi:hypothetical protein
MDLKNRAWGAWIGLKMAQEKVQRTALMNTIIKPSGSIKHENFLTS